MRPFPALRPGTQPGVDYKRQSGPLYAQIPTPQHSRAPWANGFRRRVSRLSQRQRHQRRRAPPSPSRPSPPPPALLSPGDVITVHAGTYRERVTPPRGGESDAQRIVYQAAAGEKAVIKGSEVVRGWKPFMPGVWKVTLPNSFFGNYNPYKDLIKGDWFTDKGRPHHTGEVYLNGKSLFETHLLERVLNPQPYRDSRDPRMPRWTWFTESDDARHLHLRQLPRQGSQRGTGRDQRPRQLLLSRPAGPQLHHHPRLPHEPGRHAMGRAHRRADRPHRHPLEQGLDHREQRHQRFEVLRHHPGQGSRRPATTSGSTIPPRTAPPTTTR